MVWGSHSARLWALEAEAWARCTTPGHFSLFCSLWFWNKPSFRGAPWVPSGNVNSPADTDTLDYNQPQAHNIDIPIDLLLERCYALTISLNTAIFEFSFELHAIESTKDSWTLKLSVSKFSFIPVMTKKCDQVVFCNLCEGLAIISLHTGIRL